VARLAKNRQRSILVAVGSGLLVVAVAFVVHLLTMPLDHALITHIAVGDLTAGLTTIIVCLAIQLKIEEVYYDSSIERAAIISELNHHVRNSVFTLSLIVHKVGDEEAVRSADAAVERINLALRDASTDALTGRVSYGPEDKE
jgi:hypothetical protein